MFFEFYILARIKEKKKQKRKEKKYDNENNLA